VILPLFGVITPKTIAVRHSRCHATTPVSPRPIRTNDVSIRSAEWGYIPTPGNRKPTIARAHHWFSDPGAGYRCRLSYCDRASTGVTEARPFPLRRVGERDFALLTGRWRSLRHITASRSRIGDIVKAALTLTQFEHRMTG
jgi:hypothetical protein